MNNRKPFILLVEDDLDDKQFFAEALQATHYPVSLTFADNGEMALQMLKSAHDLPLCIFMDINMPRIDGLQCLKYIKEDKKLETIPVVILSTTVSAGAYKLALSLGATGCAIKQTSLKVLTNILASYLSPIIQKPEAQATIAGQFPANKKPPLY